MKNIFSLEPEVMREFPEAQIRFVVARGLRNYYPWKLLEDRLCTVEERVSQDSWQPFDETHPAIISWHDAYRRFGTNPRRNRPSVDALSRRLRRSGRLPRINPAVDAYNLISVTHGIPAGAFDVARLAGEVSIRFARPGDSFTPLGEPDQQEEPTHGEVVYAQGNQVLTRHWNHRDSDETRVTEASSDIVFILERVSEAAVSSDQMAKAQRALASFIAPHSDDVALAVIETATPVANLAEA